MLKWDYVVISSRYWNAEGFGVFGEVGKWGGTAKNSEAKKKDWGESPRSPDFFYIRINPCPTSHFVPLSHLLLRGSFGDHSVSIQSTHIA